MATDEPGQGTESPFTVNDAIETAKERLGGSAKLGCLEGRSPDERIDQVQLDEIVDQIVAANAFW